MPNRRLRGNYSVILGLLLLSASSTIQGCLAIAWLGAVGVDMTQTSDIEFDSFENSWVVAPQEQQDLGRMKSVAVMPFAGDPMMAERWAAVFRVMTDLRVVSPSDETQLEEIQHSQVKPGQRRTGSSVDCMLIGNVSGQEPKKTFAGLKERSSQRLSLHLLSQSGTLLWKTELLYTIAKGSKDLDEEIVTKALLAHVQAHAHEVGFAELGVKKPPTTAGSPRDALSLSMAQPHQ